MADIDLIPKQYVARRVLRRRVRQLALALLGIVMVVGAARGALLLATAHEQQQLASLRRNENDSALSRARMLELEQQKAAAESQIRSLAELRGRGRAALLLEALDAAHLNGVWLDEIRSFRVLTASPAAVDATAAARPAAAAASATPPVTAPAASGTIRQRVELAGHALDHATLAAFMTRLSGNRALTEVQLLDTSARTASGEAVIDFNIALSLNEAGRDGQPR